MRVSRRKYKRRLIFLASSMCCFVVMVLGVALTLVFAAMQQRQNTTISVNYVSKQVAGTVSASYQVKNKAEKYMTDGKGNTTLVFNGGEETTDGGMLAPDEDAIELTNENNYLVLKYSFTNAGDADYVAKVSQNNTIENLTMEISKDGTNYVGINDFQMVVFNNTVDPTSYYVKFTITDVARNVQADINVTWDLQSIPRDTVAIANGAVFTSFDEAVASVNNTNAVVAAKAAGVSEKEYGVVSVLKNVETAGAITLNKDLVVYAEKDVSVFQPTDGTLFDIASGRELTVGAPYNTAELTFETDTTNTSITGSGNLTIYKGVLNNRRNTEGTAINVLGDVRLYGGAVKNFNLGIYVNSSIELKKSLSFENCLSGLEGTGIILIDEDFELSNATISKMSFKITGGNVVFNNVIFTDFSGSALDITDAEVSLIGCTVENCKDSAIKVFHSNNKGKINIEDTIIQDNTASRGAGLYTKGVTVNIKGNTVFKNNTAKTIGGVIFADGFVTINQYGGEFYGNSAKSGGAVYLGGSTYNMYGESKVYNNSATGDGGGVVVLSSTFNMYENSVVENNTAQRGGGIYSDGTINMYDSSVVTNNDASSDGGGIYCKRASKANLYDSSSILNNNAENYGDAIYFNNLTLGENSRCWSGEISGNGGETKDTSFVIYNSEGKLPEVINVSNALIENFCVSKMATTIVVPKGSLTINKINYFMNEEGTGTSVSTSDNMFVVYSGASLTLKNVEIDEDKYKELTYSAINSSGTLIIEDSTISNFESNSGGAITSNGGRVELKNTIIKNCSATDVGGAIYLNSATISATGVDIRNCSAKHGGAIFITGEVTNNSISGIFIDNDVTESGGAIAIYNGASANVNATISSTDGAISRAPVGGAIFVSGGSAVQVSGGSFTAIMASNTGGAIYSDGSVTIENATFTNCSAQNGGAVFNNGLTSVSGTSFAGCSAMYGGAIYINNTLNLTGGTISNCTATSYGGAIFSKDIIMTDGTITNCSADKGGAIYAPEKLKISGSTISSCSASNGGAVYLAGYFAQNNIVGTFAQNTATENGGSIAVFGGYTSVNANFSNTTAGTTNAQSGGAIYIDNGSSINISGGQFNGLKTTNGGAIYANGELVMSDFTISGCSAESGGAIFSKDITITGGTITNCSATNGGAIWAPDKAYIIQTTITNCSATNGGAIYLYGCDGNNVISGTFTQNTATENGGSIAVYDGGYVSISASFSNTTAGTINAAKGGAIFVGANSNIDISGGSYNGLKSTAGGAIYADGSISAYECVISNCSATNGGAFYLYGATSTITSSSFNANVATGYGGSIAIYNGANVTIRADFSNCDDSGNILSSNNANFGGAIYIGADTTASISGSWFNGLKSTKSGGAITNLGSATISSSSFTYCSSQMGGAIANAVASITEKAIMYISGLNISGCSATEGESNAIITLGDLKLTGENTIEEDICIARVSSSLQGTIALSGIAAHTTKLKISFADGSVSFSDILAGDYDNVQINVSGTSSRSATIDNLNSSGINWDEYPKSS